MSKLSIYLLISLLLISFSIATQHTVEIPDNAGGSYSYNSVPDYCESSTPNSLYPDGYTYNCRKYAEMYVDVVDYQIKNGKLEYTYFVDISLDANVEVYSQLSRSVNYMQEYTFPWDIDWFIPNLYNNIEEPADWMITPIKIGYCKFPDGSEVGTRLFAFSATDFYKQAFASYMTWGYPSGGKLGTKGLVNLYKAGHVSGITPASPYIEQVIIDCFLYIDPKIWLMQHMKGDYYISGGTDITHKGTFNTHGNVYTDYLNEDLHYITYWLTQMDTQLLGTNQASVCIKPFPFTYPICHTQWIINFDYSGAIANSTSEYPINTPPPQPNGTNPSNITRSNTTTGISNITNIGGEGKSIGVSLGGLIEAELKERELRSATSFISSINNLILLIFYLILIMFYAFELIAVIYVFVIIIPDVFYRIQRFFVHMTRLVRR
jgi:hypothetical protein